MYTNNIHVNIFRSHMHLFCGLECVVQAHDEGVADGGEDAPLRLRVLHLRSIR
jgi:hypothetical protein